MLNRNRIWCVRSDYTPEALAFIIAGGNQQTLCAAYRIGNYFWLNDSPADSGVKEYAILKQTIGNSFVRIESIDFTSCDVSKALQFIDRTLAGEFDLSELCFQVHPVLESPEQHGRCQFCA